MKNIILTIDCGNTHTTLGCVDGDKNVTAVCRIPTDRVDTEFGYAAKIKQILDLKNIALDSIEGAVISCVVPPVTDVLARAVKLITGHDALVIGAGIKTGLHICINDPGTVASDLVAAAVAAKEQYPLPCIIIDMGTATTVTAVDEKARFIGGAIFPGAGISLTALAHNTALLPHIDIQPPSKVVATNTVDCMRSGIVYGTAGAVDGILDHFAEELGEPASIVATGGISSLICPHCRHNITLDDTLLLKGLRSIWDKNQKTSKDR